MIQKPKENHLSTSVELTHSYRMLPYIGYMSSVNKKTTALLFYLLLAPMATFSLAPIPRKASAAVGTKPTMTVGAGSRKTVLKQLASMVGVMLLVGSTPVDAFANVGGNIAPFGVSSTATTTTTTTTTALNAATVAYRPMEVNVAGTTVPVAMWYPTTNNVATSNTMVEARYSHRISVRRIGQLLAGWDFIPDFASKNFQLAPTMSSTVMDGFNVPFPSQGPVIFLAHGYLGSRFDLSHMAEALAQEGFICVSAEYPESLAASYDRIPSLDRDVITKQLLVDLKQQWGIQATQYGIVGHSLGTGTALTAGDSSWARVCIAGFPRRRDGSEVQGDVLFVCSMNDGAVSPARMGGRSAIPPSIAMLDEAVVDGVPMPARSALLFDRADGPNHISFLADQVNDAMIDLLSPLLPVAQTMGIPVLDFDKYKISRDSKQTADVVIPLVTKYLKQQMKVQ